MTTPNKYAPSNNMLILPRCPHCGQELASLGLYAWQIGGGATGTLMITSLFCPHENCRKNLQLQIMPAMEESRIARPV